MEQYSSYVRSSNRAMCLNVRKIIVHNVDV